MNNKEQLVEIIETLNDNQVIFLLTFLKKLLGKN